VELVELVFPIEMNEIGGASSTYRGEKRLAQGFGEET